MKHSLLKDLMNAARLMKRAHADQTRKHGTPYWKHPMAVCRILWETGMRDTDTLQAALLHDVLENSPQYGGEVKALLSNWGFEAVSRLTHFKNIPLEGYYRRIKAGGPLMMAIKQADRQHNNSELKYLPADSPVRDAALVKMELMERVFKS